MWLFQHRTILYTYLYTCRCICVYTYIYIYREIWLSGCLNSSESYDFSDMRRPTATSTLHGLCEPTVLLLLLSSLLSFSLLLIYVYIHMCLALTHVVKATGPFVGPPTSNSRPRVIYYISYYIMYYTILLYYII